jgi:transcription elongation GreA/GreB family factor
MVLNMESKNGCVLTANQMTDLMNEYKNLTSSRMDVMKNLVSAKAAGNGDITNNAAYDEAKRVQIATETRIKELDTILRKAVLIDDDVQSNE